MEPSKPSAIEKIAGSLPVQLGAGVVATVGAGMASSELGAEWGPMVIAALPVLANALPTGRFQRRVDASLRELNDQLVSLKKMIDGASDSQFEVVRSVVIAVMAGADVEKLEYLKRAVHNALHMHGLPPQYVVHIGRVLREMSAHEARFIAKNFAYTWVMVTDNQAAADPRTLVVEPGSDDDAIISGLVHLGLLLPAGEVMDTLGKFRFSPVVAKLLANLLKPTAPAGAK